MSIICSLFEWRGFKKIVEDKKGAKMILDKIRPFFQRFQLIKYQKKKEKRKSP